MIIGILLKPATVFVSAGVLLAIAIASFYLFMKINRRNKNVYDRKLKAYNEAVEKIKQQELQRQQQAAVEKKVAPAPVVKKPVSSEANYPYRIQFMAPNGASYDIPFKDSFIIGRNPRSDFYIKNGTVAGAHCKVFYNDGKYMIQDLGSETGTFFDGNRIPEDSIMEIGTGVLQMGKVTLFVTIDPNGAAE